jgi:hypothetical protein
MKKLMEQLEPLKDNVNGDMASLLRIEAFIKKEGFTARSDLHKAIDKLKEFVKQGGIL